MRCGISYGAVARASTGSAIPVTRRASFDTGHSTASLTSAGSTHKMGSA